jgi:hypothetical protein
LRRRCRRLSYRIKDLSRIRRLFLSILHASKLYQIELAGIREAAVLGADHVISDNNVLTFDFKDLSIIRG